MSSEARERSWDAGQPVALFRFTRGNVSWFYTSSDRPQVHAGDTYLPAAISRTAIKQGAERAKLSIKITLPSALPVASNWRPHPPSEALLLSIFGRHAGETDVLTEWVGRVVKPSFEGATLELRGEPSTTSSRRAGNTRYWQRGCGLALYGTGVGRCNLNPAAIAVPALVTALEGLELTADGFAAAPRSLVGGRLEWMGEDEQIQTRAIVEHAGSTLVLDADSAELLPGVAVTAYTLPLFVVATLTAVGDLTLNAAAFAALPSGRLAGGYLEWTRVADGLIEYRSIKAHSADTITLDYGALDLITGLEVAAYPGCAHTWSACGGYQNRLNYGGDLWMPVKSPFNGSPIW